MKKVEITKFKSGDYDYPNLDLTAIIDTKIKEYGFESIQIIDMNRFYRDGIKQIITELFTIDHTIPGDEGRPPIRFIVKFSGVTLTPPVIHNNKTGDPSPLFPNEARRSDWTYSSNLYVSIEVVAQKYPRNISDGNNFDYNDSPNSLKDDINKGQQMIEIRETEQQYKIAKIPTMVGSNNCNTAGLTKGQKWTLGTDPKDKGGFFIVNGKEWGIDLIEQMTFNEYHCYKNRGYKEELVRGNIISKPGELYEHSTEHIIVLKRGNLLILTFNHPMFKEQEIPFYVFCRLLGMATDREIINEIVRYGSSDMGRNVINTLKDTLRNEGKHPGVGKLHARAEILDFLIDIIWTGDFDRSIALSVIQDRVDKTFLPHIGIGSSGEIRRNKARFICVLVRHTLLVHHGHIASSDRNSYSSKRISGAGVSFSKIFKKKLNGGVIRVVREGLTKAFMSMEFGSVKLVHTVKSSVDPKKLEEELVKVIVSSTDTNRGKSGTATSRLSTQQVHRKNQLNKESISHTVRSPQNNTASSKSDPRAMSMREVHPTYMYSICPVRSPDTGMGVGMIKEPAISALLAEPSSGSRLAQKLLNEDHPNRMISRKELDEMTPSQRKKFAKLGSFFRVEVNGKPVGYVSNPYEYAYRCIKIRRKYMVSSEKMIHSHTTINVKYQTGVVSFSTDMGRIMFPIPIVVNNIDDPEYFEEPYKRGSNSKHKERKVDKAGHYDDIPYDSGFIQRMLVEQRHIDGLRMDKYRLEDLITEGVIEMITVEEQEICLFAESPGALYNHRHDKTSRFTHCAIPTAMLSIVGHITPFAEHNQPVRDVYNSNQTKSAVGIYINTWDQRFDKQRFLMYRPETPSCMTIANRYVSPNGVNVYYMLAAYGYNQEDSLIFCESSSERGMMKGGYFTYLSSTLEKREKFGKPPENNTLGIKNNSLYQQIENGAIKVGSKLRKGQVIIARYVIFDRPIGIYNYQDSSTSWPYYEEAIVEDIIRSVTQDGEEIIKVKTSSERPVARGDKMSTRCGQKGVVSKIEKQADLYHDTYGNNPTIIMSTHSIPTRMTIGQLLEPAVGKLAGITGSKYDATIFKEKDMFAVQRELENRGYHRNGTEITYNGITGKRLAMAVFGGVVFYQRLNKFSIDDLKATTTTHQDMLTRQPEKKGKDGAGRIGEMEEWCLIAHGCMQFYMVKLIDDSDYFVIYYCRNCHSEGIVNEDKGIMKCTECDEPDIVRLVTPWVTNLFLKEIGACNIGAKLIVKPYTEMHFY